MYISFDAQASPNEDPSFRRFCTWVFSSAASLEVQYKEDHNFEFGKEVSRLWGKSLPLRRASGELFQHLLMYQGKPQKTLAGVVGRETLVIFDFW